MGPRAPTDEEKGSAHMELFAVNILQRTVADAREARGIDARAWLLDYDVGGGVRDFLTLAYVPPLPFYQALVDAVPNQRGMKVFHRSLAALVARLTTEAKAADCEPDAA